MRAEQFKFLSSVNTNTDDDSKSELEETNSDDGEDVKEIPEVVCSLCHDPNSKIPVSFFVLLQVRNDMFLSALTQLYDRFC